MANKRRFHASSVTKVSNLPTNPICRLDDPEKTLFKDSWRSILRYED
jgi:hypothetical protein